jgi:hypothetical protein
MPRRGPEPRHATVHRGLVGAMLGMVMRYDGDRPWMESALFKFQWVYYGHHGSAILFLLLMGRIVHLYTNCEKYSRGCLN